MHLTFEQLQQLAETTSTIVHNLQLVTADGNDLDELEIKTTNIVSNLSEIENSDVNIGGALGDTFEIVDNLSRIEDYDLNDLSIKTQNIITNMKTIGEMFEEHEVVNCGGGIIIGKHPIGVMPELEMAAPF
jgi:hypothetical protein